MRPISHILIGLSALACADAATAPAGNLPVVPAGEPNAVQVVTGQAQTDTVGQELPQAISVRVLDAGSKPVAGQILNFVVTEGGGSVFAGAALTDDSGRALERWTLGTVAGAQALEARAVDQATGQPIVFATVTATAVPDRATMLDLELADTTVFVADTLDGTRLGGYAAADRYGNPITGATFTVQVTGWQQSGPYLWSDAEARGLVRVSTGMAADSVMLLAIRDLRDAAGWTASYACYNAGPFVHDNVNQMVDSALVALVADSVVYDGVQARIYFVGTVERWWEDGDYESEAVTRSQSLTQAPDSLRYGPGDWGVQVSPGRYEGGNWCGTGVLLTFDPVVLVEG